MVVLGNLFNVDMGACASMFVIGKSFNVEMIASLVSFLSAFSSIVIGGLLQRGSLFSKIGDSRDTECVALRGIAGDVGCEF